MQIGHKSYTSLLQFETIFPGLEYLHQFFEKELTQGLLLGAVLSSGVVLAVDDLSRLDVQAAHA